MFEVREPRLYTTNTMARHLGVTLRWLRAEAEAGRIPHVKAEKALLFDPEAVERVLLERANESEAFVSPRRAAQLLGLPEGFLRREAAHRRIPHLKDGARILFNPAAVRAALLKRNDASTDGLKPAKAAST